MDKKLFNIYYLQIDCSTSNDGYSVRFVSEDEFNKIEHGAMFYLQKPSGNIYMWGQHF